MCGSDMSALEDTTKQHYIYFFDPEYVSQMRTPGFDPHLDIAQLANLLTPEQVEEHKKGIKSYKKERNIAKVVNFSCLPIDNTQVLTKEGWKDYKSLKIGEEIFSLNIERNELELTKIDNLYEYKNAEVLSLSNSYFYFECTPNHRWLTSRRHKTRNKPVWRTTQFVEARDLTTEDSLIVSAQYKNVKEIYRDEDIFKRLDLPQFSKKDIDYTSLIINMSYRQREIFIKSYCSNKYLAEFSRGNILDAFLLALTLNGYFYNVSSKTVYKNNKCVNVHIYNRNHVTCQRIKKNTVRNTDVFCLSNKNQTFIAKQGNKVVITGNSVYGAGPPKIAESIGISLEEATKIHKTYWERNKAVKQTANAFKKKVTNYDGITQMWLLNPISKLWISLRYEKDAFSSGNQSSGVFCFDTWLKYIRKRGIKISYQYHDEIMLVVPKEKKEELEQVLKDAIEDANKELKLNVPLGISVDFGKNYKEVH